MNQETTRALPASTRTAVERRFATHDGTEIFYRFWPSAAGKAKGAIILLHRGHEHGGRMAHLVDELAMPNFAFYAWDARGNGRSGGERGSAPSFAALVRDLDRFVDEIRGKDGFAAPDIAVIAQSVGAVITASWLHDYAPRVRAAVLASPAFSVKLYVPFARQGIALWQKLKGPFVVNSYVTPRQLTQDEDRVASYESDLLITRQIGSGLLTDLLDQGDRIVADAGAITVPTLLLVSGDDRVVHQGPQHEFFVNLGSHSKERHVLAGFRHDTLGEKDRAIALDLIRTFLARQFAAAPTLIDRKEADLFGYTRDESDRLATPLAPFSPKGLYWAFSRASIRFGGWLSEGMATGVRTGFDSGSTLDYVYEDQARPRADRPLLRSPLPRCHRMAGYPAEEGSSRGDDRVGGGTARHGGPARPSRRHRRRPWPLCARRDREIAGAAGEHPPSRLLRDQCVGGPEIDRRARPAGERHLRPRRCLRR
jgi:alpha-beta hydrolase superfamily lysophospholipase